MSKKYIVLGSGRTIGLGKYVAAWKRCLELPPEMSIGPGISGWGETAAEAIAQLRAGLDDRINRNIPGYGKGRKWSTDWYWSMWRASRDLNEPRLVVRWIPEDLMKIPKFKQRVIEAREAA